MSEASWNLCQDNVVYAGLTFGVQFYSEIRCAKDAKGLVPLPRLFLRGKEPQRSGA
jgi:hypothetical protein